MKKALEKSIADDEAAVAEAEDTIANLKVEIEALDDGIKDLDKSVAEATESRKEEHDDYVETLAGNNAAKDLLGFAKNRLNKFYNPSQYKAPPKRELTEEERITVNMGGTLAPTEAPGGIAGTGIAVLAQSQAAPPPPPESLGAYKKKGEESTGVIAMIDLLVKDLDKEMQVAEVDEKDAQSDYETAMKDAAEKRASDAKLMDEKETFKAETESKLQAHTESKAATVKELMATEEYIASLHGECDWLLKYFDVRKEARAGEIDSLGKAKAILSGADFSLLQSQRSSKKSSFLRGASFLQQTMSVAAPEDELAKEMTHDLEINFNKIAPFGKEDTAKELQDHAAKTQDTLVDAVENAEVAEIKRAVFRALTRLRA